MSDNTTYKRILCIDKRACQSLYAIVCAMIDTEEFAGDSGEGTLEALLITLFHYWINGDDGELYRAVEAIKVEDTVQALALQRLSKLDAADFPELAEAVDALKMDFPESWTYYLDDVDLDDNRYMIQLTLEFHTPVGVVHPKMESIRGATYARQ